MNDTIPMPTLSRISSRSQATNMLLNDTLLRTYYRIEHCVGQGAMSAVYQALDLRNGDLVAIKHVAAGDERLISALDHEARLLAQLCHPILPRVREYFADAGGC